MDSTGPPLTALTGSIGSGKSTAARFFAEFGAQLIDADELARAAVEPGSSGLELVTAEFGAEVLNPDRTLNRGKLGSIVFADAERRVALEQIIHPLVQRLGQEAVQRLRTECPGSPLILHVIPLLFETQYPPDGIEKIIVVSAPADTCLHRIMLRDSCTRELAEKKLSAQLPIEIKEQRADYVVRNFGTLEELRAEVRRIFALLTGKSPPC